MNPLLERAGALTPSELERLTVYLGELPKDELDRLHGNLLGQKSFLALHGDPASTEAENNRSALFAVSLEIMHREKTLGTWRLP